jgi:hypothetical protein
MQVSPGTELVWSLANLEAVKTRRAEIEPDHFFCGLLQFIAIPDEGMNKVGAGVTTAALCAERDQAMKVFRDLYLTTRQLLPEMRRTLGGGSYQAGNQILHRSQASHDLFVVAVGKAEQSSGVLEPRHLLLTLLEKPTAVMQRVMRQPQPGEAAAKAQPPAPGASPMLDRYGMNLSELAKKAGTPLPSECAPQVVVLSLALRANDPAPLLLVCEQQVPVVLILESVCQGASTGLPMFKIDWDAVRRDAPKGPAIAMLIQSMLSEAATKKTALFFELTRLAWAELAVLLQAPAWTDGDLPRVVVAVNAQEYTTAEKSDQDLAGLFRVIWLHQLRGAALPDRI